ncbi:MAG: O-antigen ligase family protein [Alphaproteobacteria bacterium]|nr:O-antigen ligase family protein [Alphaproteobacteria bacterium]
MTDKKLITQKVKTRQPLWFELFLLLLVLMPLPFGSNRPWASDLFALLTGALTLWMLFDVYHAKPFIGPAPRKRLLFAAACFALVLLWTYLQTASFMPTSWHHPLWAEAQSVLGAGPSFISLDPDAFWEAFLRFGALGLCFLVAFTGGRDRHGAFSLVKALAFAGVFYALYGLVVQAAGGTTILWYEKWAYEACLSSTFVNKNSYATYGGLGLLCTLAFLIQYFRHMRIEDVALAAQSRKAAFIASLGFKEILWLTLPFIYVAALSLSCSRAGVASTLVGMGVFFMALAVNRRWGMRLWGILTALGLGVFLFFLTLGGDALLMGLDQAQLDEDSSMRLAGYNLVRQAIMDNPWLGFGLGSFENAFRLYRDSSLPVWFHHAHNDYLETAFEFGLPAFSLLMMALFALLSCCLQGVWGRKRGGVYPALACGALALVGTHAFMDFSMHIPAIAATAMALLGVGVAQSWSSRQET